MQHAEICRTLTEKINLLKDKHEMLSSLLPDVRLLYGTQPGPRTPVMYQPGIVFRLFGPLKLVISMSGLFATIQTNIYC